MPHYSIRKAGIADAGLIADISRYTFYKTFVAQNSKKDMDKFMEVQFTRDMLVKEVYDEKNMLFLCYDKEQVAGYMKIKISPVKIQLKRVPGLLVSRLYAMPAYLGKGVGSYLMDYAIQYAQSVHLPVVWLGVWEKNLRAINFYTHYGFKKTGSQFFLLGDDLQADWVMVKQL